MTNVYIHIDDFNLKINTIAAFNLKIQSNKKNLINLNNSDPKTLFFFYKPIFNYLLGLSTGICSVSPHPLIAIHLRHR